MKKTILITLTIAMIATTALARAPRAVDPTRYKGSKYDNVMEFINYEVEQKGLRGTEMVEERAKQRKAFFELTRHKRSDVKRAFKDVCTDDDCDYAEVLYTVFANRDADL